MPSVQEKGKIQQEKFQAILYALLRDEDNKYCVDCDAKGPRWASWNLGIFLCIRCAGIHRNLGVHLSKVKSVNLDSWTEEQVAMMQEIGNSRGRAIYEANIPDHFRRPQTDSAIEAFIRTKYEQKKYIAAEWTPPKPKTLKYDIQSTSVNKTEKAEHDHSKDTKLKSSNRPVAEKASVNISSKTAEHIPSVEPTKIVAAETSRVDLLGLDDAPTASSLSSADLFGEFVASSCANVQQSNVSDQNLFAHSNTQSNDIFISGEAEGNKKVSKDAIMALYGPSQNMAPYGSAMRPDRNYFMPGIPPNMVPVGMGGQTQAPMFMYGGVPSSHGMMQPQPGYYPVNQPSTYNVANVNAQLAGLNLQPAGHQRMPGTAAATMGPTAAWSANIRPNTAASMTTNLWH